METPESSAAKPYAAIEEEWRTTPTDLGGWANRASTMLYEARRLHEALEAIRVEAGIIGDSEDADLYIDRLDGIEEMAKATLDA